jgi:rhamnosyltransferase
MKTILCIPTLNAGSALADLITALRQQIWQPDTLLVIDSGSSDDTVPVFIEAGAQIHRIDKSEFDHGGTRQLALELLPDADIYIYLTQDAVPAHPEALSELISMFRDKTIGAVYGRQLPRTVATPIEAHARLFNYPEASQVRSLADAPQFGIKTVFFSNSFSAYRRTALQSVDGFPNNTIMGEDTCAVSKMLLAGWKVGYCASAMVFHSHDYQCGAEFRRYFDIGVLHARESWIRKAFGQARGEGLNYVRSELKYLMNNNEIGEIPSALLRTVLKFTGYQLGCMENRLPLELKIRLSMHKGFWRCAKSHKTMLCC